jgi:hypothetical protein
MKENKMNIHDNNASEWKDKDKGESEQIDRGEINPG